MFSTHKVPIPSSCKGVLRGKLVTQGPLLVGTDDPIYFISSAPYILSIIGEAACKEGISNKVTVQVRLSLQDDYQALIADAGDSTYLKPVTIEAQAIAEKSKLVDSLRAAIQTHIQNQNFFTLLKKEASQLGSQLEPLLQARCKEVKLNIRVEAWEITYRDPSDSQLAELAVRAGRKDITDGSGVTRVVYETDQEMGNVLNHFDKARLEKDLRDDKARRDKALRDLEALRQQKLNEVAIERTKAENEVAIEQTKAAAGPELEKLRQATLKAMTDSKIIAMNEEIRLKEHEAKLKKQEQQWEQEALERNSAIMEMRAKYEADYKSKRQEEESTLNKRRVEDQIAIETARLNAEKSLAAMRATVAQANEVEAEFLRRQKQLDADLEITREKEMAAIRSEEIRTTAEQFGAVFGKVAIPAPDYSGVHTLILGTEGNRPGDMITTLLVDMLSKLTGTIESHGKAIVKTQGKAEAQPDSV